MMKLFVVIALCFVAVTFGAKLPSFIQACSRSDPNVNKCIADHANAGWPTLVKGSKEYKLIPLSPLKLSAVDLEAGSIKMRFDNAIVYNLKNMKITKADFNFKEKLLLVELFCDDTWLEGDYKIDGKLLILPISGEGHAKFRHYNNTLMYTAKFDFENRDGHEYVKIVDVKIDASTTKGIYNFDNLFNGNKQLTDEMNNFLSENWTDFWTEMKPTFEKTMVTIAQSIIDNFFNEVPMDELFLP